MSEGIRVNMSTKEGSSRTVTPLPSGRYLMAVTDCDLVECGPNSKNPGKPMFKMELTVQDGDYNGRLAWTNVMLFEGALYSIAQMLTAQGIEVTEVGERAEFHVPGYEPNTIPGPEFWMGKQFIVRIKLMGKRKDPKTGKEYDERAEVKGFAPTKDAKGTPAATGSARPSLLP